MNTKQQIDLQAMYDKGEFKKSKEAIKDEPAERKVRKTKRPKVSIVASPAEKKEA